MPLAPVPPSLALPKMRQAQAPVVLSALVQGAPGTLVSAVTAVTQNPRSVWH